MKSSSNTPDYNKLDELVKLYPRIMLLIDEYSMISNTLLNTLNDSLIRTTNRCVGMGGIKTLFFGDIAQLLPIKMDEGPIWESAIYNHAPKYSLHTSVRQVDSELITVLNKVRICEFDEEVIKFINKRTILKKQIPMKCLRLYTTRLNVDKANTKDFEDLEGEPVTYSSHDSYNENAKKTAMKILRKETRLPKDLILKLGMPVMLIQNLNIPKGWVNRTIATIDETDEENICLKKSENEDCIWIQRISRTIPGTSYVRSQFPIVPAFATTIHKAQSLTIDAVAIHLDNMLSHGQMYVAMSRVRKTEDLFFFGSELPLAIKRKFGLNLDAIDIVEYYDSKRPKNDKED